MEWRERLAEIPGELGVYCHIPGRPLFLYDADRPLVAASVIKLPILVEAFRAIGAGELFPDELVTIRREDKLPSCGALSYMHDGLQVTLHDLLEVMIILSDNTATNLVLDRVGLERVNDTMQQMKIPGIRLRRKLFDGEAASRGLENTVTARGIGVLLERLQAHTLLGDPWDGEMLQILRDQRLNGKMPFYLHVRGVPVAHKTGEDDGITHDVGIIYGKEPIVLCMLSNKVDVPAFERLIQDAALECWQECEEEMI